LESVHILLSVLYHFHQRHKTFDYKKVNELESHQNTVHTKEVKEQAEHQNQGNSDNLVSRDTEDDEKIKLASAKAVTLMYQEEEPIALGKFPCLKWLLALLGTKELPSNTRHALLVTTAIDLITNRIQTFENAFLEVFSKQLFAKISDFTHVCEQTGGLEQPLLLEIFLHFIHDQPFQSKAFLISTTILSFLGVAYKQLTCHQNLTDVFQLLVSNKEFTLVLQQIANGQFQKLAFLSKILVSFMPNSQGVSRVSSLLMLKVLSFFLFQWEKKVLTKKGCFSSYVPQPTFFKNCYWK
jgi:hypothetical protein